MSLCDTVALMLSEVSALIFNTNYDKSDKFEAKEKGRVNEIRETVIISIAE